MSSQLVRVDDAVQGITTTYTYDYVGNILAVRTYAYSSGSLGTVLSESNYTYDSQNKRTDLSYDDKGNLLALDGFTFTWQDRRLAGAVSDNLNISYTYNYDGIRTGKTVNGITTSYTVDDNNNVVSQSDGTNILRFVYDSKDAPVYMVYNGTTYYYEKNLQGDVVGLIDENGNSVVQYSYDVWGRLLSISGTLSNTVGLANPLRYCGYYYDTETGLYSLQSRYYDPKIGRFISADDPDVLQLTQGDLIGSNLYAYCNNNPVNDSDPTGYLSLNSALAKVGELLNKVVNKFTTYLKSLIMYKNGILMISTTVIATTIDAIIATVINGLVYRGIKTGMNLLLRNQSIRNSFVGGMFSFFLNNKAGKFVLWTIVHIGFIVAGRKGAVGTAVDSVMKDFLANIAFSRSQILQKASSLISAFSSVGGTVALFLDLMDRRWDNYVSLRI